MKMPDPMIPLMTIIVASNRVRRRANPGAEGGVGAFKQEKSIAPGKDIARVQYRRLPGRAASRLFMKLHRKEHDLRDEPHRTGPRRIGEDDKPQKAPPEQRVSRSLLWWILAAALLLIIAIVSRHFDEFLRRTLETKINQRLHGYSVTLGGAHLSPFNFSLTLRDG